MLKNRNWLPHLQIAFITDIVAAANESLEKYFVMTAEKRLFLGKNDSYQTEKFMRGCRFLEADIQDMDRVLVGQTRTGMCG
uniref:Uncharacterized protein n=1 Tax=Helianthus annuus TaxID=4232 RepID=A0A251SL90_HELAN